MYFMIMLNVLNDFSSLWCILPFFDNVWNVVIVLLLAATIEENILSYEPVITQECEFCILFVIYYTLHFS